MVTNLQTLEMVQSEMAYLPPWQPWEVVTVGKH